MDNPRPNDMSTLSRAQIPLLPLQALFSAVHRLQQVSRGVLVGPVLRVGHTADAAP